MAIFPSIRELFGTPAPQAPMSPAQAASERSASQAGASTTSNGTASGSGSEGTATGNATVPSSTTVSSDGTGPVAIPAAGKGDASPLSEYKEIWKTPVNPHTSPSTLVSSMTADPAKMLEAARTIDFTKGMDPTLLDSAAKGDSSALAQIINSTAQNSYAQGAQATVAIAKKMMEEQATAFSEKYAPAMLRSNAISREVERAIPLSNDPAAAPIVAALRQQLSNSFPTASPEEVTSHVENYLQDFARRAIESKGGRITTAAEVSRETARGNPYGRREDTDWTKFFEVDGSSMNS